MQPWHRPGLTKIRVAKRQPLDSNRSTPVYGLFPIRVSATSITPWEIITFDAKSGVHRSDVLRCGRWLAGLPAQRAANATVGNETCDGRPCRRSDQSPTPNVVR